MKKLYILTLAALVFLGVVGVAQAVNLSSITETRETEDTIAGDAHTAALHAALLYTQGGRVTDTEVDDEESYYEVEVTLDNGDEVDVQLNEEFEVVGDKRESQAEVGRQN